MKNERLSLRTQESEGNLNCFVGNHSRRNENMLQFKLMNKGRSIIGNIGKVEVVAKSNEDE